jgi:uncharacterized protein (DUF2141 family)
MLNRFVITALLSLSFFSFLPVSKDGITVTISHLRNNSGHALISLFREGEGFPDQPARAFRKERVSIVDKQVVIHFPGIPGGSYAIAILHDENDDTKMNTNWLGLPKEGYGFSNNIMGTFGPPPYNRARFSHVAGNETSVEIRTKY